MPPPVPASRFPALAVRPLLWLTVVLSVPLWLLFLAQNPPLRAASDAALLLAYLLLFHAVLVGGVCGLVAALLALRPAWRLPAAAVRVYFVGMTLAVVVALNGMLRFPLSYAPFRQPPYALLAPLSVLDLIVLAGGVCLLFLSLRHLVGPSERRSPPAIAWAGWVVLAAGVIAWNLIAEAPRRVDLDVMRTPAADPAVDGAGELAPPVVVLGLDGLSWHVIAALLEQDRLPHLGSLVARGARANLASTLPSISPIIWTTIATGRAAADHRILGASRYRLPGMNAFIATGPSLGTMNWWNGINRVLGMAADRRWIERAPFFSSDRMSPALWEIADRQGVTVGVFGWQCSWPVRAVGPGSYLVSDTSGRAGSTTPTEAVAPILARAEASLPRWDADSPLTTPALADEWRQAHTDFHAAIQLHRALQPRLSLVYSHFVDGMQHQYWRGAERTQLAFWPEERRFREFPPHIADSYALADQWVGDFLAVADPHAVVVVVSDHGYSFDGQEHHRGPDGVLIVAGPGINANTVLADASIFDVAPTTLAVLGLPIADELPGRVLTELFSTERQPRVTRVAAYDWFEPGGVDVQRTIEVEEAAGERMRALGYVE